MPSLFQEHCNKRKNIVYFHNDQFLAVYPNSTVDKTICYACTLTGSVGICRIILNVNIALCEHVSEILSFSSLEIDASLA